MGKRQDSQKPLIMKVCVNRKTGQKYITIPRAETRIEEGDYVRIAKVE